MEQFYNLPLEIRRDIVGRTAKLYDREVCLAHCKVTKIDFMVHCYRMGGRRGDTFNMPMEIRKFCEDVLVRFALTVDIKAGAPLYTQWLSCMGVPTSDIPSPPERVIVVGGTPAGFRRASELDNLHAIDVDIYVYRLGVMNMPGFRTSVDEYITEEAVEKFAAMKQATSAMNQRNEALSSVGRILRDILPVQAPKRLKICVRVIEPDEDSDSDSDSFFNSNYGM